MKRWFLRISMFIFWGTLLACGVIAYEAHHFLSTPASQDPSERIISIASGATFDRVAWDLKKAGAITDVTRFRLLAQAKDALGKVRAGEFLVSTGWTPEQVLRQITQGQAVLYRLSLREGLTWWETARAVEEQGFARYDDFKAVIHDSGFLLQHNIPFATAEGFLYPETYLMQRPRSPLDKEQARMVASALVNMFWKKTEPLWIRLPVKSGLHQQEKPHFSHTTEPASESDPAGAQATTGSLADDIMLKPMPPVEVRLRPKSPEDIDPDALIRLVILASLVEKETGLPEERERIAGVYANRLRLGMLLQCDPTIIYGIGESFSGAIRRSQIDDPKNPYNTYQHPGLPPGPICSPGLESLNAAGVPEKHDFLYFVATGTDNGHTFSKTLSEHNKAVQGYRFRMRDFLHKE